MFIERRHGYREKKWPRFSPEGEAFRLYGTATLTDDHALFLLHQERLRLSEVGRRPWRSRLFRRR